MSSGIESVLQEKRVFPPSAEVVKQANIPGMEAYRKMVAEAERADVVGGMVVGDELQSVRDALHEVLTLDGRHRM